MRCPDCNKFVSFNCDEDPEVDIQVDDKTGEISGNIRITNNCGECGQELKEANFEVNADVIEEIEKHRKGKNGCKEKSLSVDADVTRSDWFQEKDRRGRPIKSFRYRKHFYGVEAKLTVTCDCGKTFETEFNDSVTGGGMDELV